MTQINLPIFKGCPFCGKEPIIDEYEVGYNQGVKYGNTQCADVNCQGNIDCDEYILDTEGLQKLADRWNNRPIEDLLKKRIEYLLNYIEEIA